MKALKYFLALWAAIAVYSLSAFFFGAMGLSAYRQLENEQNKQEANIESLAQANRDLGDTVNSLLYDKDTLAVYARQQGYAEREERFIRIVGLGGNQNFRDSAGEIAVAAEPQYVPDRTLRIIAVCAAITLIISMAAFDVMRSFKTR